MRIGIIAILILITTSLSAQNQNISLSNIFDGEPYIAVNPNNPQHLVVAWMGFVNGNRIQIKTKYSIDAGTTWSSVTTVPHTIASYTSADPSLAFDNGGNVYVSYVDFTGQNANPVEGGVYVSKSTNNGSSWSTPVEVIHTNDDPGTKCIDRPWMVIDKSNSTNQGNIYITTMNAKGASVGFNPYFSVSTDGGNSFNWRYLDTANYLSGSVILQPMPTPTVSSTGMFYAVYPSYAPSQNVFAQYLIASSSDHGNSFNYHTVFSGGTGISDSKVKSGYLLKSDPSNAQHLCFIYLEETNSNVDVFIRESYDAGVNWSSATKINDDTGNALQDLLWANFDTDGDLLISWRDRRNGTSSTYTTDSEIWGSVLWKDSTNFFPNFRISDTLVAYDNILAESGNDFMCIDFVNDTLNAVWGDTRTGKLNIWYQRMAANGNVVSIKNLSTEEFPNIIVYPNPIQNQMTITGDGITKISIYSTSGQLIANRSFTHSKDQIVINTSEFKKGTYLIKVTTANGIVTKNIIKN